MHVNTAGVRRKRCGKCSACLRSDCGSCVFCKDKPKFGGAGKKKKCCALKRCQMFSSSEITVTTRSSMKRPNISSQGQACGAKKQCTVSTPVTQKEVSVYDFLKDSGRKVHMVKGDGNCLFRSMSYELFKTEEHHIKVRNNVVWLISCNREEFSKFLLPVNCPTISDHITTMSLPNVWGTHIEIIALSTLLQIPVYTCSQDSTRNWWEVIRPLPAQCVRFPLVVDSLFQEREPLDHIELLYFREQHYDAIVCAKTGKVSTSLPQLTGEQNSEQSTCQNRPPLHSHD